LLYGRAEKMSLIQDSKDVYELIKKGATLEAEERMLDLRGQIVDLESENIELKREVQRLLERLEMEDSMVYRSPYYMRTVEGGEDGPFCQRCWDDEKKAIRLQNDGPGYWYCNKCQVAYTDDDYVEPDEPANTIGPMGY
jgi:hypothetical protein